MGYPEDALAGEEELLLHRHPHWKMLFLPAVAFILASAIGGFLLGLEQAHLDGTLRSALSIALGVLWFLIVGWRCAAPFIRWKTTHFIVTDRRVLVRQGVFTHTGIDIPMARISNVQFRHGLVDRMLGTGTLIVGSASEDPLEFDDVPQVESVHALLYHEVFDAGDPEHGHDDRRRDDPRGDLHRSRR